MMLDRIVSGGQTGVDRAALDEAIKQGIEHGGWCPRGRIAEDGRIPDRYRLSETRESSYRFRTERNVTDSDGTLILFRHRISGGTELTKRVAVRFDRPHMEVDLSRPVFPTVVACWLEEHAIRILNVAGPRESQAPGIAADAQRFLRQILGAIRNGDQPAP